MIFVISYTFMFSSKFLLYLYYVESVLTIPSVTFFTWYIILSSSLTLCSRIRDVDCKAFFWPQTRSPIMFFDCNNFLIISSVEKSIFLKPQALESINHLLASSILLGKALPVFLPPRYAVLKTLYITILKLLHQIKYLAPCVLSSLHVYIS